MLSNVVIYIIYMDFLYQRLLRNPNLLQYGKLYRDLSNNLCEFNITIYVKTCQVTRIE